MIEVIELQTHSDRHSLALHNLRREETIYTCLLVVRSGGFICEHPFTFDDSTFPDAIDRLKVMDRGNLDAVTVKARWEEDWIRITNNDMGHVFVEGELHEYGDHEQRLVFGFKTDQTVLRPLIKDLERLLEA